MVREMDFRLSGIRMDRGNLKETSRMVNKTDFGLDGM